MAFFFLLGLGSACARAESASAPIVVSVDRVAGHRAQDVTGAPQGMCTLYLKAEPITKSGIGCFLHERVSKGIGVLTFPCTGDGPASAVFGTDHYEGQVREAKLTLALETELDWHDGCHWVSHHTIHGAFEHGASGEIHGALAWKYADNPSENGEGNDDDECSGACTASTRLHMTVTRPADPKHQVDEEMLHLRSP